MYRNYLKGYNHILFKNNALKRLPLPKLYASESKLLFTTRDSDPEHLLLEDAIQTNTLIISPPPPLIFICRFNASRILQVKLVHILFWICAYITFSNAAMAGC